jgi:hypothetical protein
MTAFYSGFHPIEDLGAKGSAAFTSQSVNTATIYLYRRSATALTIADVPNGDVVYTFATTAIDITDITNGWSVDIPTGDTPLYVVSAFVGSNEQTTTIETNEWASPALLAKSGLNTSAVSLYQRNNTGVAPSGVSVNTTYTFSTGILSGSYSPWSQTIPDSSLGRFLFITTVTAIGESDTTTITSGMWSPVRLFSIEGVSPAIINLTNDSVSVPANADGSSPNLSGATTTVTVFEGGSDVTGSWTLSATASSGITGSLVGNNYTVTAFTVDSGTVTFTATRSGYLPLSVVFSLAKAKAGVNGTPATVYELRSSLGVIKRTSTGSYTSPTITFNSFSTTGSSAPTAYAGRFIIATSIDGVNYTNRYTSSVNQSSYTYTILTGINFIRTRLYLAGGTTTLVDEEVIPVADDGLNGIDGIAGSNNAIVYLYQRAATAPAAPSGTFTYTFATGVLSGGTPGSWTQAIPANNGSPLWVIAATASANTSTDTIAAAEFSTPVTLAVNGTNGTNGTDGLNSATVFLYQRATSAPAVPSATTTYTFATGILTGTLGGWSQSVPTGTNPLYVTTATAVSTTATDTILTSEWATVRVLAQNGVDGAPGTPAVSGYLTNEAATVFAYANGIVASYAGATGNFVIVSGNTDISSSFTLSTVSNPQTLTVSYVGRTYTISGGLDAGENTATLTIRATGSGAWTGVTLDKVFTLAKTRGGYEILSSLPAVGDPRRFEGSVVFLTTDDKLYRFNGTAWTTAVPSTDISGQLADAQIAALAASKVTGQLSDAQLAAIAAAKVTGTLADTQIAAVSATKVTGQLTNTQIADLAASKVTGQLTNTQIADLAASKVTGQLSDAQISAIAATKVTGQITGTQITNNAITSAKIDAGAVTAGKIAAGTVTATEIATNAVTAVKISAGAVTAGKIAAGTVTATEIATNAVTAAKISAGAVTAGKIAADAVTANEIAANAVTAAKISAGAVTAGKIAANAVTANEIAAGSITTAKIAAGAITSNEIAANTITAADIAASTITATQIAASTITGAKIAAGTIQAGNIAADTITADKIAANAITASELSANAVTADKINAGAVTAAKISVSELSSITANIGTLTAGTIRNGANTFRIDATNGRTITQTGAFMKVTGAPFGSSNQFIEWYGPYFVSLTSCTEANATYYLKTDGSAYFGGNLSAGILKTAVQTSSLASNASVETGNFGSNGNTIQVVLSYYAYSESPESFYDATTTGRNAFNAAVTAWGATPQFFVYESKSVSASASIALDRSVNNAAFTNGVATLSITTGTETIEGIQPIPGDSPGYIKYTRTFGGSLTYTDPQTVAQNRNYRARITSRDAGILAFSLNQQQRVGLVSTE